MSGLWTVTINRLHLVSKFDDRGNKISETVTKVPITFNDLPYSTAQMYVAKAPGEATMTQQIREFASTRGKGRSHEVVKAFDEAIPPVHLGSEEAEFEREILEAAKSGDLGAALTSEVEA